MRCIVGCDPDVGGALAVITSDDVGNVDTVRIFDCPTKPVDVNGKARTRVCVDGMVKLVRELDLPPGTVAHLEVGGGRSLYASQSCFVQGAASGQWLGVLVSHGLDVRLVAASTWKWALKLARRGQVRDKNASRELAKRWFANESNQVADALKRVKDHGRAEALLIAARGGFFSCQKKRRQRTVESEILRRTGHDRFKSSFHGLLRKHARSSR